MTAETGLPMKRPHLSYVTDVIVALLLAGFTTACKQADPPVVPPLEEIAANEEVLAFMRTFDGRGALTDSSVATPPNEALKTFRHSDDLNLELVLSEPEVTQPVFMTFDHRGRLWVVQYNQYPYPKDLKVTSMDQHIRATFDKVPPPPGDGSKGADKITFFEDTDADGSYDKATDAITGLNIATSVALGRGKIWVLNPPYLLAYPDADDDGLPDGTPEVHLEGFGIEDTHAVANNLRWGPDGWIYGAQGSTCTANVSSKVSRNVRFDGQAIWRYHPETRIFEVYAEGGGNTFDVEVDAKGRLYSGDNGTSRGQYYKQGAYYPRNFGKHGALTNPYAFGHLGNMELTGEKVRFTHAFVRYEGGQLPDRYKGGMIAINPLQGYIQLSKFEDNGSTFRIVDVERIVQTDDHWFRPVDIVLGPDGGVYVADWYDSRLSHVDPRDTWSKANGRIYRLSGKGPVQRETFDIARLSNDELVGLLAHENRWFRQQALRVIGDRKDKTLIPRLEALLGRDDQLALEALWALHATGGFTSENAIRGITHKDPFVRMWAVRLSADKPDMPLEVGAAIAHSATVETHPEVRSQLAASAKKLPSTLRGTIIRNMLGSADDSADPDIPLQLWWALEAGVSSDSRDIIALFEDQGIWRTKVAREVLLSRLMQRFSMARDSAGYAACAKMLALAPSGEEARILINGLQEGLRGASLAQLPPVLIQALKPYEKELGGQTLALSLRQGDRTSVMKAIQIISDGKAPIGERLSYIRIFGEVNEPDAVPALIALAESNQSSQAVKQSAIQALQRYDDPAIGERLVKAYPDKLRADPGVRMAALTLLSSRPSWAMALMNAIDRKKQAGEKFIAHTISKNDVTVQLIRQIHMLNDPETTASAFRIWPDVRFATSEEKTQRISEVSMVLQAGNGHPASGKKIFASSCGPCHRLFEEGGTLGPDLTGYERRNVNDLLTNIVDPGAYVREGFEVYRVSTADGRVLSGTVASRTGQMVTLNLVSGGTINLPETEINEMEAQPSMMPDNLLERLSDQEVRDLFAFLTQTDK